MALSPADVRFGVAYVDEDLVPQVGTAFIPVADNVRSGVATDATTGTITLPATERVVDTIGYGSNGNELFGIFVIPVEADVKTGVNYGGGPDSRTGTYDPDNAAAIAAIKAKTDLLTFASGGGVNSNTIKVSGTTVATGLAQFGVNIVTISGTTVSTSVAQLGVATVSIANNAIGNGTFAAGTTIPRVTLADAVTAVNGLANGVITAASIASDAITDAKVASDVTIASVTGAVGSVSGNVSGNVSGSVANVVGNVGGNVAGSVASVSGNVGGSVASVTGNVGGNVSGSVGSVAAGGITASSLAADCITESKIADGAINTATFVAGCTLPRVTLVDTATTVTNDVGVTQAAADKVWNTAARTLTSFGTLVADVATAVWSTVARTITGGTIGTYTGNTPQTGDAFARLGVAGAGLTALSTLTASDVWSNGTRTITGGTIGTYTGNTPQTGDTFARIGAAGAGLTALSTLTTADVPTVNQIVSGVFAGGDIDGNNFTEHLRLEAAALWGRTVGAGTTTVQFYAADGSKVRLTATVVVATGNRTSVAVDET